MPTKAQLTEQVKSLHLANIDLHEANVELISSRPLVANGDSDNPDFSTMTIWERLHWIREQRAYIEKKITGSDAGFSSAVAHTDLVRAVRPLFQTAKVMWFPLKHDTTSIQQVETSHGTGLWVEHHWTYRFQSIDDSSDFMDIEVGSTGWSWKFDGFDKGAGKASTYADKYALLRILMLESGDDPDFTPRHGVEVEDITEPMTRKIIEIRKLLKMEADAGGEPADKMEVQTIAAIARKHSRTSIKNIFGLPEEMLDEWLEALVTRARAATD